MPPPRGEFLPGSVPTTPHPDAVEVARTIARGYRDPSLSTVRLVAPARTAGTAQRWVRHFDGGEIVGTDVVTGWASDMWQTHWYRELHQPVPVRRVAVIPDARARAIAGLKHASDGSKTRLVYFAVLKQLSKVAHPTNAMDVENVIDCYRLSIEVRNTDSDGDLAYVDAYTGDVVQRIPHPNWVE